MSLRLGSDMRILGLRMGLSLACLAILGTSHSRSLRQESEQGVKAAFVYNFTRFVTWPTSAFSSPSSPFVMGLVGNDDLQAPLESIVHNKTVGSRPIVVKHVAWADVDSCNLIFISADESSKATQLSKLKGKCVLIVSEAPGMLRRGSTINLFIEQERVLFEISSSAAKDTDLTFSSHLLSLARSPH